jgi:hypothetical protein
MFAATLQAIQDPNAPTADSAKPGVVTMQAYKVEESSGVKTHTLFMGADIDVKLDRDLYRVRDVVGSSWVVDVNGRSTEISAKHAPLNLKVTPMLKLTETSATISALVRAKAYSFDNDPSVMLTRGLNQSASANADLNAMASNAQARADTSSNHALGGASVLAGSDDQFSANALMTQAEFSYSNTHPTVLNGAGLPLPSPNAPSTTTSTAGNTVLPDMVMVPSKNLFNNPTNELNVGINQIAAAAEANQTNIGKEQEGKLTSGGLDALDVDFDVRSDTVLREPYVVTITRFRAPNTKPGMVQNLIYAKSLHPIDALPEHIHFTEEGFPFGYEMIEFHLHLYNAGKEIATNVAPDRVELTSDEAFQYVLIDYLSTHRHETLPASPAMGKLPTDLAAKLAAGKYGETFYVRVSKLGTADQAFSDPACTSRIGDPYLDSVVSRLRFKPALVNGKETDGTAALNLKNLAF